MNEEESAGLLPFLQTFRFPLLAGVGSLFFLILSIILLIKLTFQKESVMIESNPEQDRVLGVERDAKGEEVLLVIDVSGAVKKPGIVRLPLGSRISDAIELAGGLSAQVDSDYLSKKVNLAAQLVDGMKVYIPLVGDSDMVISSHNNYSANQSDALVNMNTASLSELDTLPGIGPVTAQSIIDHRPYGALDELVQKQAVNQSQFEKIQKLIAL